MAAPTLDLSRFIPKFLQTLFGGNSFRNNAYILGQSGAIWISTVEPYDLYNRISELRSVIDRDANMFSNMKIYKVDKNGQKIEDPKLDLLLNNPNCTQSQNQFLKQYRQQLLTYGNQFIYRNKVNSASYPISLWNISPFYLQPVLSGRLFNQIAMNGIIEKYHMINNMAINDYRGTSIGNLGMNDFETDEILFTRINDLNNPIIGRSPMASLQYPLSNIETAYRARNVGHQLIGVNIISPKPMKDMTGSFMPTNPHDKKLMEEQFGNDYGISESQRRTILSKVAVDVTSIATPTKDMMLLEEVNADIVAICNAYHVNPQIFLTDTTYENLRSGIVQTYQDSIIPAADEFMQALSPFVGLKPNEKLKASFEHVSILQENKLKGFEAIESVVRSLTQATQSGLITAKQAISILEKELGFNAASY